MQVSTRRIHSKHRHTNTDTHPHTQRHTHLDGADGVEEQWRWVGQDHMPEVGVRQAAALELEAHKMGGGLQIRGAQFLTKC